MKSIAVAVILSCTIFVGASGVSKDDEIRDWKYEDLPESLQLLVKTSKRTLSGFCCRGGMPVHTNVISRVVQQTSRETFSTSSSHSCGFLWASRCNSYSLNYRQTLRYYIQQDSKLVKEPCPDNRIECCPGFKEVVGSCISNDVISTLIKSPITTLEPAK